jgi:hypothetical protein
VPYDTLLGSIRDEVRQLFEAPGVRSPAMLSP